jgi:hypothetical protein
VVPATPDAIDDGVNYSYPPTVPWQLGEPGNEKALGAFLAEAYKDVPEASAEYHTPFDTPYNRTGENLSLFPFTIPLREWDWNTRRKIVERCHLAYERNPLARRAVKINTQFAIGEGLSVTYRAPEVEALLEAFRADVENNVQGYEKEFSNDIQLDGELLIRFFTNSDGDTVIVPLKPWEIPWIECDREFIKRVKSYHRQGYLSNGVPGDYEMVNDDIPAAEVLHVALNKSSYEQRGRPELFTILPWLRAYKDWIEDRARQNKYRGSVFMDLMLTGAQQTQVATKRAQYKQPPPPGSLYIHNDKEQMTMVESKVGANDVAEDGRQIKLMNAVGMGQPEYMLSDGQNANLASASAQQLPALRSFGDFQDIHVNQIWRAIYKKVIENAIAKGTLKEMVAECDADGEPLTGDDGQPAEKIKAVDAFDVAAPELETDDPFNLAQALQIQEANGWISKESASTRAGNDWRVEKRKIDSEQAELIANRVQGKALGPVPDVMQPVDGQIIPHPGVRGVAVAGQGASDGVPQTARSSGQVPTGKDGTKGTTKPGMPESQREREPEPMNLTINNHLNLDAEQFGVVLGKTVGSTLGDKLAEAQEKVPAPTVVNVTVPESLPPSVVINIPEQPAPVVNVTVPVGPAPVVQVTVPEDGPSETVFERDEAGRVVKATKTPSGA